MSVIDKPEEIKKTISELSSYIVGEHLKGKIPLFVIGSGISTDLEIPKHLEGKVEKMSVPNMFGMLKKLQFFYNEIENDRIREEDKEDLDKRFKILHNQLQQKRAVDRTNVGEIFRYFQEKEYLKEVWIDFNEWLLTKCVDEKNEIGIIDACPSKAHHKIAELYEKVNAFCLTTNFDGLIFKALEKQYEDEKNQSYWEPNALRAFLTQENVRKRKSYAEVQIRGDIFFVKCDPKWCDQYEHCQEKGEKPKRIWELEKPLKCEKGEYMKPFISFPGTYEKDKEVREILNVLWQYLTSKVSCVITIGIGGVWDPILIAFLSDLVRERDIPLINVTKSPDNSHIHKEIVTSISERIVTENKTPIRKWRKTIKLKANDFMDIFNPSIDQSIENSKNRPQIKISYPVIPEGDDKFWDENLPDQGMSDFEKELILKKTVEITREFAQLGLKSRWYGVKDDRWLHNRLNHAKGVMKIATCLYDASCEHGKRQVRAEERQFLRIAALLHDIGHLPFSHLIEEVFQELNWKPSGYVESFNHDYYTKEKIKEIFKDAKLKGELNNIGYTVEDLIRLINGNFGIGFLDAIINGPFDADKIDYVFRDTAVTKVYLRHLDPKESIDKIQEGVSISPEGLLVLKESSTDAAFEVLTQRESIYKKFYLNSALRLLEKAVKFIIITYYVHTYNTLDIPENIKEKFLDDKIQIPDLGAVRIAMAVEELEKLSVEYRGGQIDTEWEIISYMYGRLKNKALGNKIKDALRECFSIISNIEDERGYLTEESKRKLSSQIQFLKIPIDKSRYIAKTVGLRFPGAILIDILPPFEFFKITGSRRHKKRSDGTSASSESFLSESLITKLKAESKLGGREQIQINMYKLGEASEVSKALDLFKKLQEEERPIGEEE